ncbi:hypothetical protein SAMN02982929_01997 [Saccharopolyspora kobensis]|uniref:Uncharacterized protein n=1 Tax=Saccharopolyspora kobensis TaxID=146035 RepID=A0A1H5ZVT6_9PSEU|nr:DUF6518 family protein [Saccharopolyspora kobensis]SEG39817.1 hypothetical protein SAMN02982929_01997 [Saccharopolyspora kobensis]SFE14367.1 hypothetical protein SAMN05216506_10958 [Saccharopolyspora kobensis]
MRGKLPHVHATEIPGQAAQRHLSALAVAVAAGLALGALTAFGQQWLPESLAPLANSASSWALTAFLVALLATRDGVAAASGSFVLVCMLIGYVVANQLRGYPSSSGLLIFWGAAAVVVGPLLGLGAHWLRHRRGARAALGGGGISGVLIGEGVYGLRYIADTTPPSYWWGQIAVGLLLLAAVSAWRLRPWRTTALGALTTASVAVAFVFLYSHGGTLISLL